MDSHDTEHEGKQDCNEQEIEDGSNTLNQTQTHVLEFLDPVDGLEGPHRQHYVGKTLYCLRFPVEQGIS